MNTKITQNIKAVTLGLIIALGVGYVSAWTGPSILRSGESLPCTPPKCNVDAPINVGGGGTGNIYTQTKSGILNLAHLITSDLTVTNSGDAPITRGQVLVALDRYGTVGWGAAGTGVNVCPSGQFVTGFDANGDVVCMTPSASVVYYFGGMYSPAYTGYGGYKNPLANNTFGCPTNYKPYLMLGTANVDNALYSCIGSSDKASKVAEFGGMYSPSYTGYSGYKNPLAVNTFTCPSGYTATQALGETNIDNVLYYCYSTSATPVITTFGGIWGGLWDSQKSIDTNNPVTGSAGCSSDYTAVMSFGKTNVDYLIHYCYK